MLKKNDQLFNLMFLFFYFLHSNVSDNKCHKHRWRVLCYIRIKLVVSVLVCVHAIACIKWIRLQKITNQDLDMGDLTIERALGIHWNIENDKLGFKIQLKDKPLNRRGMLFTISSVYDPLGIAAPFALKGCQILQKLCQFQVGWDEKVLDNLQNEYIHWQSKLPGLENIKVNRCYKPERYGSIMKAEVHHFSDASEDGYGQCLYLRIIDQFGAIHCSLLTGKSRVSPIKFVSIPRLELTAVTLFIRCQN